MLPKKNCDENSPPIPPPDPATHAATETESPKIYDSADLLQGAQEVLIRHHNEIYRLRLTRNDKLILNK